MFDWRDFEIAGNPLTPRERQVVRLLCSGLSNKVIADRLHISISTVKHHLHVACMKRRVRNRTALAVKELADGILRD